MRPADPLRLRQDHHSTTDERQGGLYQEWVTNQHHLHEIIAEMELVGEQAAGSLQQTDTGTATAPAP
jgi:hypothetical protein